MKYVTRDTLEDSTGGTTVWERKVFHVVDGPVCKDNQLAAKDRVIKWLAERLARFECPRTFANTTNWLSLETVEKVCQLVCSDENECSATCWRKLAESEALK
jgi:hypothetical protein